MPSCDPIAITFLEIAPKLFSEVVSSHRAKSLIELTGELWVKACADFTWDLPSNLVPWVTPATRTPIINITIDNSISEKACFFIYFPTFFKDINDLEITMPRLDFATEVPIIELLSTK